MPTPSFVEKAAHLVMAAAVRGGRYSPRCVFGRCLRRASLNDAGWLLMLGYLFELETQQPASRAGKGAA